MRLIFVIVVVCSANLVQAIEKEAESPNGEMIVDKNAKSPKTVVNDQLHRFEPWRSINSKFLNKKDLNAFTASHQQHVSVPISQVINKSMKKRKQHNDKIQKLSLPDLLSLNMNRGMNDIEDNAVNMKTLQKEIEFANASVSKELAAFENMDYNSEQNSDFLQPNRNCFALFLKKRKQIMGTMNENSYMKWFKLFKNPISLMAASLEYSRCIFGQMAWKLLYISSKYSYLLPIIEASGFKLQPHELIEHQVKSDKKNKQK